jgi:hypothetical protein
MLRALQTWFRALDHPAADATETEYDEVAIVDDTGREVVVLKATASVRLTLSNFAETIHVSALRNLPLRSCRDLFRDVRFIKLEDVGEQEGKRSCTLAVAVSYPPVLEAALGNLRLSCCESANYELNLDAAGDECTEFLDQSRIFNRENLADYLVCLGRLLCHLTLHGADSSSSSQSRPWGRFESPRYTDMSWGRYLCIVVNDERAARSEPLRVGIRMYGLPALDVVVGDAASLTAESVEELRRNHERSFLLLQSFFSLPMTLYSLSKKKYVFFASHPHLSPMQRLDVVQSEGVVAAK